MPERGASSLHGRWTLVELGLTLCCPFMIHVALWTERGRELAFALAALLLALAVARFSAARLGSGPHPSSRHASSRRASSRRASSRRLDDGFWLRQGMLLFSSAVAACAASLDRSGLLLCQPVISNLALLVVFASSLLRERTLIETLARLRDGNMSEEKIAHCRRATVAWSVFFASNALVAGLLAGLAPLAVWTLYTGVGSHLVAALLGLSELFIRVRHFGLDTAGPFGRRLAVAFTGWNREP